MSLTADQEFVDMCSRLNLPWDGLQEVFLNQVNGFLGDQLDVTFRIRRQEIADLPPAIDSVKLLAAFEEWGLSRYGDLHKPDVRSSELIDIMHLTTGRRLQDDIDGIAIQGNGRGQLGGCYGLSAHDLGVTGGASFFTDVFGDNGTASPIIMGHEIGHNLGGAHELAKEYCVERAVICLDYQRTLMWWQGRDDTRSEITDENRAQMRAVAGRFRSLDLTHRSL